MVATSSKTVLGLGGCGGLRKASRPPFFSYKKLVFCFSGDFYGFLNFGPYFFRLKKKTCSRVLKQIRVNGWCFLGVYNSVAVCESFLRL